VRVAVTARVVVVVIVRVELVPAVRDGVGRGSDEPQPEMTVNPRVRMRVTPPSVPMPRRRLGHPFYCRSSPRHGRRHRWTETHAPQDQRVSSAMRERNRSVRSAMRIAAKPTTRSTTVSVIFMPTLKASSAVRVAWPRSV